ncbi:DNA-binding NarL/FixJ family response regulator [Agrobacterium vitis]|nr:DNA-binding NarL/FixJ family response regulator [Agrobacterium vitis]MBE1439617.1 DNA-binding NarL/FixJ family response regulator [Agrobacterium vitis]
MSEDLTHELLTLLGKEDFFALVEAYAGIRLYIPGDPTRSELPETIGMKAALRLAEEWPCGYIKVPLAREFRIERYVENGMSNRAMAQRFGMTESGVERLLKRARASKPLRRSRKKDPRQSEMF